MERSMRYPSNRDWRLVMKSIHRERIILLSDLLDYTSWRRRRKYVIVTAYLSYSQ